MIDELDRLIEQTPAADDLDKLIEDTPADPFPGLDVSFNPTAQARPVDVVPPGFKDRAAYEEWQAVAKQGESAKHSILSHYVADPAKAAVESAGQAVGGVLDLAGHVESFVQGYGNFEQNPAAEYQSGTATEAIGEALPKPEEPGSIPSTIGGLAGQVSLAVPLAAAGGAPALVAFFGASGLGHGMNEAALSQASPGAKATFIVGKGILGAFMGGVGPVGSATRVAVTRLFERVGTQAGTMLAFDIGDYANRKLTIDPDAVLDPEELVNHALAAIAVGELSHGAGKLFEGKPAGKGQPEQAVRTEPVEQTMPAEIVTEAPVAVPPEAVPVKAEALQNIPEQYRSAVESGKNDITLVDEAGSLVRLYRGTASSNADPFRKASGVSEGGAGGAGIYLALSPEKARTWAGIRDESSGVVHEATVRGRFLRIPYGEDVNAPKWNKIARDLGYDGIFVSGQGEVVVFDPQKIDPVATTQPPARSEPPPPITEPLAVQPEAAGGKAEVTPKFKLWFRASKVVDENGSPMAFEHQTGDDFTVFNAGEFGFHFGRDIPPGMLGHNVIRAFLSIQRPLRMRDLGIWSPENVLDALQRKGIFSKDEMQSLRDGVAYDRERLRGRLEDPENETDASILDNRRAAYELSKPIREALEAKGYDGFVYKNEGEGFKDSYVVFRSEQIKSATGNSGEFDPKNPDIYDTPARSEPPTPITAPPSEPVKIPPKLQPKPSPEQLIGIKNAAADAQAAAYGDAPPEHGESIISKDVFEEAARKITEDPTAGKRLVDVLAADPRPPSTEESALLSVEAVRLVNERAAAGEAYKADPSESNNQRVLSARADYQKAMDVVTTVGTKSSQAFGLRRFMLKDDMSVAELERQQVVRNKGTPVTEERTKALQEIHDRYEATLAEKEKQAQERLTRITDLEKRTADLEAQSSALENYQRPRQSTKTERIKVDIEAAWKEIDRLVSTARAGPLDPELLKAAAKLAGHYIRLGVHSVADFAKAASERVGGKLDPYIESAWREAQRGLIGKNNDLTELARHFVQQGETNMDVVASKVHELVPDMSRDQVMESISGYGKFRPLSKDQVSVQLRAIKGEMQQVLKLKDMIEELKAPSKTGIERREPSKSESDLIHEVNVAKKKLGIETTDPETQLRSALDTAKKNVERQIAEREERIKTGLKKKKDTTPGPTDPELEALRAKRDSLDAEIKATEPRVDPQETALAKQIKDLTARIDANNLAPKSERQGPPTESVANLKKQRDALSAQLADMRKAATPKRDPLEVAVKARIRSLENRTNKLKEKRLYGDFSKPTRKTPLLPKDPAYERAAAEHEQVKIDLARLEHEDYIKNRTTKEAARDTALAGPAFLMALKAGTDASVLALQGGAFLASRPKLWARVVPDTLRATFSEQKAQELMARIKARETDAWDKTTGLELTELDAKPSMREEAVWSELSKKIPVLRHIMRGSARGFTLGRNLMAVEWKNVLDQSLGTDLNLERSKVNANLTNVATGRGYVGKGYAINALVNGAAQINWAPRLMISRFEIILGQPLWKPLATRDPVMIKHIAKEYARIAMGMAVVQTMLAVSGDRYGGANPNPWSDSGDAISPHFMETRFGKTWVDPTFGLANSWTFLARLMSGRSESAKGKQYDIRGEKTNPVTGDAADLIWRFEQGKLGPTVGAALDTVRGHDMMDKPAWTGEWIADKTLPIGPMNVYEALRDEGLARGTALGIMAMLGWSTQSYAK